MTQRTTPEILGADRETGLPRQKLNEQEFRERYFFSSARLIEEEMKSKFVSQ